MELAQAAAAASALDGSGSGTDLVTTRPVALDKHDARSQRPGFGDGRKATEARPDDAQVGCDQFSQLALFRRPPVRPRQLDAALH
jgi:hypothetical protein